MSETTICNLALGRIGSARIIDISEDSVEARACALHYSVARDEILRSHRWNFAIDRETLTALAEGPAFGWGKQYQLPQRCLRVLQLNGWEENSDPPRWEVEGRYLMTNETDAQIKFIQRIEDTAQFDALFVQALACKLAALIAKDVTGSDSIAEKQLTEYERVYSPTARRIDGHEARKRPKPPWVESALVKSRQVNNLSAGHDFGVFV